MTAFVLFLRPIHTRNLNDDRRRDGVAGIVIDTLTGS